MECSPGEIAVLRRAKYSLKENQVERVGRKTRAHMPKTPKVPKTESLAKMTSTERVKRTRETMRRVRMSQRALARKKSPPKSRKMRSLL
jgi:hypothetical protein